MLLLGNYGLFIGLRIVCLFVFDNANLNLQDKLVEMRIRKVVREDTE